ncbi:MAG: hypothetical protein AAF998_10525 [Bacteroidota bacterium]
MPNENPKTQLPISAIKLDHQSCLLRKQFLLAKVLHNDFELSESTVSNLLEQAAKFPGEVIPTISRFVDLDNKQKRDISRRVDEIREAATNLDSCIRL